MNELYGWMNKWLNEWMNEQIISKGKHWMLYFLRIANQFICKLIMWCESCERNSARNGNFHAFLAIFAAWCAVWCAVIWSFPFIWTMCDTRTYHWFDSRCSKKFYRSCISPNVQGGWQMDLCMDKQIPPQDFIPLGTSQGYCLKRPYHIAKSLGKSHFAQFSG